MSVKSNALTLPLVPFDRVIGFVKTAGAESEDATERDGFLSYHAETHALGTGIGVGFAAAASGELQLVGFVVAAILYGNRGSSVFSGKLLQDINQEKQYFLAGLVVGAVLGVATRFAGLIAQVI